VDTFIEGSGGQRFADGQNNRDLRVGLDARDQDTAQDTQQDTQQDSQLDTNPVEALKQNPADERYRRIGLRGRETLNRPIPARLAASCNKTGPKPCEGKPFGLPGVEIGEAKRKFRLRSSRPERISSSKQNER
jgi:hypothetical protein